MTANGVTGTAGNSPVSFGRYTYGFDRVRVMQWGEGAALRVGSFCSLAEEITFILGGNHRTDWISTYPFGHIHQAELGDPQVAGHPATRGDIVIGHDVWLAHGCTIMSGVTIGDGAAVGARAVVSRDVPPYAIVAGNPAEVVRFRFDEEVRELLLALRWWDLPLETIRELTATLCSAPTPALLRELIARHRPELGG
ncbi:CatB-related O-acetyltransferase [Phenylobacterium soli]|uniref:Antibiotic acetyltransferase n=1 Tax=Phenylobacterium soli TaxID=2170551 RepID=A0A328AS73_9CAUL|nr:CatB-related O-acetyltransferase [Phenylobacterium soli]RAK55778.1 antibiotic acetyltransferase [Phenylobacterium soli]